MSSSPMILTASQLCLKSSALMKSYAESLERRPVLAVCVQGDGGPSWIYIRRKMAVAQQLGIEVKLFPFSSEASTKEIQQQCRELGNDPLCDGILVQLPLAAHVDLSEILKVLPWEKDVDGLSIHHQGLLAQGHLEKALIPCTPLGVIRLLKYYGIELRGKHMLVLGRSFLVGRPLALYGLSCDMTVTMAHSKTVDVLSHVRAADIIVTATGFHPILEWKDLSLGQILIDVGIHRHQEGFLHGDMAILKEGEAPSVLGYTPVPGSVGPMTINSLMYNIFKAHAQQHGLESQWKEYQDKIDALQAS